MKIYKQLALNYFARKNILFSLAFAEFSAVKFFEIVAGKMDSNNAK